jgi:UDP:flavonoid glycosyltransferase YjiC (YdhE family)
MNSVLEAAFQGTPLLCIPLTADQFYNAFAMQWRQTAIVVDKDQLVDKKTAQEKEQETAEEKQEIFEQKLEYFEGKLNEALDENKHKQLVILNDQ